MSSRRLYTRSLVPALLKHARTSHWISWRISAHKSRPIPVHASIVMYVFFILYVYRCNLTFKRNASCNGYSICFKTASRGLNQIKCACAGEIAVCNAVSPFDDIFHSTTFYFVLRYSRSSCEVVQNVSHILMIWGA